MTELINLIRNNIKPFNIGPVDAFRDRINAMTNIDDLISLRSSLEHFDGSCSFPGLLEDYSFGRYVTEEWNVSVDWYANHYNDETLNIDFYGGGGKWKSVWDLTQVIDLVRHVDNALVVGDLPDQLSLTKRGAEVTLTQLNTDEPWLYISNLYDAKVKGQENIATFIAHLMLDTQVALVKIRMNTLYDEFVPKSN